jgi:nucleotide-binding universal stress UspA family protein
MTAESSRILVGIDDAPDSDVALNWAVDDARTRTVPIRLVYAYHWELPHNRNPVDAPVPDAERQQPRHIAEQVVARAIDRARERDAGVTVDGEAIDGKAARVLLDESAHAAELVLGSRHLKTLGSAVLGSLGAAVAARSACPVVVTRGPAGLPDEGAGVVVGIDGTEASETVLAFGFDHASRHRVPLRAVLCWHQDPLAAMSWRPEPPAPERAEAWLSETLAGWRERYPDVVVHPAVVREHPVAGLVLASAAQYLLVVGSHGRHALAGTLLGSVSQGVLHHATCPVAIVPTHRS